MTHLTFPKPVRAPKKPNRTVAKARAKRRRASEKVKAAVYAAVDERDGGRCRNCASRFNVQHHHLTFRSQGGTHTASNVILVCGHCHDAIHQRLLMVTGDGDGVLDWKARLRDGTIL